MALDRSASVRSTKSFHMRYFAKEKCPRTTSSTTSKPGASFTALRTLFQTPLTSTPLRSSGNALSNPANIDLEIFSKHFQQRRVESRFIVVRQHPDATANRLAYQRDRHEDQGCAEPAAVLSHPASTAENRGQDTSVRAALLQCGLRLPVDGHRSPRKFSGGQIDEDLLLLERFPRILLGDDFAGALKVQFLILRLARGLRNGTNGNPGAFCQFVLQLPGLGTYQGQARLGRTVV